MAKKTEPAITKPDPKATKASKKVESKKAAPAKKTEKVDSKKTDKKGKAWQMPTDDAETVTPAVKEEKPVKHPPNQQIHNETHLANPAINNPPVTNKKPLTLLEQMALDIAKQDGIDTSAVVVAPLAGGGGLGAPLSQPIQMNGPNMVKPGQDQNNTIGGNKPRPVPKGEAEIQARVEEDLNTVVAHLDKFQKSRLCHKQHVDSFLADHNKDGYTYKYHAGTNKISVSYYDHTAELPFELDTAKVKKP